MSNIAIKVKNLSKHYKLYSQPIDRVKEALSVFGKQYHTEFKAVSNLSFEVNKGETVGIIGRNGCGKSTLLKMITDVLTPSSGRVIVHGHISAILELGSGFNPEMTGLENIYLNASINGLSYKQTAVKVDDIIAFSELGEFIHQPIKTYSSGMNARLAFAVAINVDPDILIIDEALSVGDAAFQRKCFAKMDEIRGNGATILFVSHSETSIISLCNRAIWLNQGEIILDGSPKLLTGLYLKCSNANKIDKESVLIEYNKLVKKQDVASNMLTETSEKTYTIEEFYDPNLKPTSTIYYAEEGAKITDVMITTLNGKAVNVLTQDKEYLYTYNVRFFNDFDNIKFGMLIKTKNGIELGGALHPSGNTSFSMQNGKVKVTYKFKCLLNIGEYFFNAGVQGRLNDRYIYFHRILDAYRVKVLHHEEDFTSHVNFIQQINIEDIL